MRTLAILLLASLAISALACGGTQPQPTPAPISTSQSSPTQTPDISATVAAAVSATTAVEVFTEATVTRNAEAARRPDLTPSPTVTPEVVPTPTIIITATAAVGGGPTPEEVEQLAGKLYACLQENVVYRERFKAKVVDAAVLDGAPKEEAADWFESILSDRESFLRLQKDIAQDDPLYATDAEVVIALCKGGADTSPEDTGIGKPMSEEMEDLANSVYDCMQENKLFKESVIEDLVFVGVAGGAPLEEAAEVAELMANDRGIFIAIAAAPSNDGLQADLDALMLDLEMCESGR